jgi:hypothetical protein
MREHVDLKELDVDGVFSVLTSLLVDEVCHSEHTRQEAREIVMDWIRGKAIEQENLDPATWGKQPEQVEAATTAMEILGGPAGGVT